MCRSPISLRRRYFYITRKTNWTGEEIESAVRVFFENYSLDFSKKVQKLEKITKRSNITCRNFCVRIDSILNVDKEMSIEGKYYYLLTITITITIFIE